jgi:drug/metabolite transporter (DMT)-like permease
MKIRTLGLAAAAMVAFAANSVLCRAALGRELVDAASFTTIRVASGALALVLLVRTRETGAPAPRDLGASAALFAYALGFSLAYVRIPAALGALLLFGAVQVTMVGRGLAAGERPRFAEWAGLALSVSGLLALTLPGASGGDLPGVLLMLGAGAAWGVYSLLGRSSRGHPVAATAVRFAWAVPMVLLSSLVAAPVVPPRVTAAGVLLAVASGALASGLGYAVWYAALPGLTATRAALVQLSVPPLAALGGVAFLGEEVSLRLALSAAAILGGIALAMATRRA